MHRSVARPANVFHGVPTIFATRALIFTYDGEKAGEDAITLDLLKNGGPILLEKRAKLFTRGPKNTKVPVTRQNANIILIHKKGHIKELKHYRRIRLLSVFYKLFAKDIVNRISETIDYYHHREKIDFTKDSSKMDHIHGINQVNRKSAEYNKTVYLSIIDYEKAFDCVDIAAVIKAL